MANYGFQNHALCPSVMMMWKGSRLSFLNRCLISLRYPSLFWLRVQFDQRTSIDVPDPSPFECRFMSILWNRDVLLCRRFVSGVFFRRRWFFRLSTGDVSLTRGYGGFTWIFDPGIKVLAEDEDVVKLVFNGITPSYFMEKKKISQVQWFPSRDSVTLSVFGEEEKFVSDPLVSNRKTNQLISEWPYQFSYTRIGILSLFVNISNYGRDSFTKQWKDRKASAMITAIYDCLIVVATTTSSWYRIGRKQKSIYFLALMEFPQIDIMMDFGLSPFGFYWFVLSNLHVGLVIYWRQGYVGFAQIGRLENVLATLRWVLLDMRGSGIWDAMINFSVVMLKRITQAQYFKETLVRKCWCQYVYIPELALDTSALINVTFCKKKSQPKVAIHNS